MKVGEKPMDGAQTPLADESNPALTPELVTHLYTSTRSLVWGFPAGSVFLAAFLWKYVDSSSLLAWIGAILLVSYWRHRLIVRYGLSIPVPGRGAYWGNQYMILELAAGTAAGMVGAFLENVPLQLQAMVLFTVSAELVGGAVLLAAVKRVYLAFLIPATGTMLYWLLSAPDMVLPALLLPLFGVIMGIMAYNQNRLLVRSLALGRRNEQLLRDLLARNREVEEAYRAKSDFLANMSHELRTPMHAILSFSALGEEKTGSAPPEKLHTYFSRITQSGERMLNLVNDLLDLAKLEAGRMQVKPRRADLRQVAGQVAQEFEALIKRQEVRLKIDESDVDAHAWFDIEKIHQVLRNLLSNAIKFTPGGKNIRVSFEATELQAGRRKSDRGLLPALACRVSDQGAGIPPDELESIFDKFQQSSRTDSGSGGTGLGLAICSEIMQLHGGSIRAELNDDGGADLVFTLPRNSPAA